MATGASTLMLVEEKQRKTQGRRLSRRHYDPPSRGERGAMENGGEQQKKKARRVPFLAFPPRERESALPTERRAFQKSEFPGSDHSRALSSKKSRRSERIEEKKNIVSFSRASPLPPLSFPFYIPGAHPCPTRVFIAAGGDDKKTMDMAGEGHQEAVSPEAIAAAIRAATPVTTSLEKILQEGAQPMGQPPWALLNATPVPQPTHGGYSGHILPGVAFLSLGFWWLLGVVRAHAAATPQRPFVARAWYPVFLDSSSRSRPAGEERREQQQQRRGGGGLLSRIFCCFLCRHSLPLEPCLILALCLLGVNAELWLGHDSFRTLHRDDC